MITTRHAAIATGVTLAAALSLSACGGQPRSAPPADATLLAGSTAPVAPPPTSTVTAVGTGTASGEPDTLTISISISSTAAHAAAALGQDNSLTAAVDRALKAGGVAATDIQTTNLSLQQNWANQSPSGYVASDQVTATLRDLATAGKVVDDALAPAGDAGRLDQANLSISDTDPVMQAARQKAVKAAEAQAQQMAAAAGDHLGNLVSLTDATNQPAPYQFNGFQAASGAGSAAGPAVPIEPGRQQLTVNVTGVWQVLPGSGG